MKTLVFLLEELSAKAMLKEVLPHILPKDVEPVFIHFEGKKDLERNVEKKIRGWKRPESRFIIMCDKDGSNCKLLKSKIVKMCQNAGRSDSLVRIACHELESFYLGDLEAVVEAYNIPSVSQRTKKYRNPDVLANASEELRKLTKGRYQKIEGSRKIAQFLRLDGSNVSSSFNMLIDGIRHITTE